MNKSFTLLVFLSILGFIGINAQNSQVGEVEFNGASYPAYIMEMDASDEQATNAVKDIFSSRGEKGKSYKGFLIYRNVAIPAIGSRDLHDVFVKVEPIGKKINNRSKMYLIITKPGAIQEDKLPKDEKGKARGVVLVAGGASVFTELTPAVENQVYLKNVLDQEEVVRKAEKRLMDLQTDSVKLGKQLQKIQTEQQENNSAIEQQAKELEAAKMELLRRKTLKPKI